MAGLCFKSALLHLHSNDSSWGQHMCDVKSIKNRNLIQGAVQTQTLDSNKETPLEKQMAQSIT